MNSSLQGTKVFLLEVEHHYEGLTTIGVFSSEDSAKLRMRQDFGILELAAKYEDGDEYKAGIMRSVWIRPILIE